MFENLATSFEIQGLKNFKLGLKIKTFAYLNRYLLCLSSQQQIIWLPLKCQRFVIQKRH